MEPHRSHQPDPVANHGNGVKDFRQFLEVLEKHGELVRHRQPVSLRQVAALIASCDKAMWIERPGHSSTPLLANILATRRRWAIAMGVEETEVMREMVRRAKRRIGPERVATGAVKEIVQVGSDADLTKLPVHLHHERDGGPYITAALDISRKDSAQWYNIGIRRLMLRGPRETGVDLNAPSDLRGKYRAALERGATLPVAFVIGSHPMDYVASQLQTFEGDEYELLGAMRKAAVPLVKCETVDLEVPADAEIVLEGHIEGNFTEVEGPFGEYHGGYGHSHLDPVFKLSAIMRRRDALFQTATIAWPNLYYTDQTGINMIATEARVYEAVAQAVREPRQVYSTPAGGGVQHVRVCLSIRDPGDGKAAAAAALTVLGVKLAIVVDDDVDIFDDRMVEWALSTRYQADRDTVFLQGMKTIPLEPSLPPHDGPLVTTAKLGLDATRRYDKPAHIFDRPCAPFVGEPIDPAGEESEVRDFSNLVNKLSAFLKEGPRFLDILGHFANIDQGVLLRALGELRDAKRIRMDRDGRYFANTGQ